MNITQYAEKWFKLHNIATIIQDVSLVEPTQRLAPLQ